MYIILRSVTVNRPLNSVSDTYLPRESQYSPSQSLCLSTWAWRSCWDSTLTFDLSGDNTDPETVVLSPLVQTPSSPLGFWGVWGQPYQSVLIFWRLVSQKQPRRREQRMTCALTQTDQRYPSSTKFKLTAYVGVKTTGLKGECIWMKIFSCIYEDFWSMKCKIEWRY